ncbi:MAG: RNA polymerase sigma factor, partial [Polyangiaceae bacterium]
RVVGARDAEDLVQATFMTAFKVASAYDGRGESARPWLYGILSKHIHERRRSLLRCARAILRLGGEAVRVPTTADRSDLSRGLELLSEAKRVVLLLAEVEGYSAHEIADLLGVPVGTVWTRLHHARRQLRVFYGDPEST